MAGHDPADVQRLLSRFPTLWVSDTLYVKTYTALARKNQLIGPNDLWSAASALEHELALLTRDVEEFRRVPGLHVIDYAAGE